MKEVGVLSLSLLFLPEREQMNFVQTPSLSLTYYVSHFIVASPRVHVQTLPGSQLHHLNHTSLSALLCSRYIMHVPTFYRALDSTHCALCHRWAQYFAELDEPSYPQALRLLGRSKELVVQEDSHHNADNANTSTNANMSASPQTIHLSEKELDYERAKALMEEVHLQRIIQLEEEEKQLNEMFEVQSVAMDKFQQKLQLAVQQIAPFLDEENCDWGMDLPTLFDNDWNATNTRHRPHPNCVACGEEAGPNNHFTKYKITSTCEHAPLICKLCLQKWIKTQLEGTAWDKIACPECTEVLSHADIKLHATKAVFER